MNLKKIILLNIPYVVIGLLATNLGEAWRLAEGVNASEKVMNLMNSMGTAFQSPLPSFHPLDLCIGLLAGVLLRIAVHLKSQNAKKYRKGMEYGSARWGTAQDMLCVYAHCSKRVITDEQAGSLMLSLVNAWVQ